MPPADADPSPKWGQWLDRAKRLHVGDTVVLNSDTQEAQRAALAWVGEDQAPMYLLMIKV